MFGPLIVQFLMRVWSQHGEAILAAVMKKLLDKLNTTVPQGVAALYAPQGFDAVTSRVGVAAIPADIEKELQEICDKCKQECRTDEPKSQSSFGSSPPSG